MGLRKRQEAAFESLYSRHVRDVYGYALGVLGSSADAEDVTQTTFLNAYRAMEDGKRPHSPRSWLFAIAHNVCRQRFRQAARRPREVELHDAYAVEEETDAPSASDIARALQSLPFTQRSALVMRELEGRSQAEIADALGVSVSAVETLLFRARRGMREQLESSLTCGEAARAISRQLDGASSRAERSALRAHLRVCEECATFARRARARSGAMRRLGGALPLPAGLMSWTFGGGAAAPAGGIGLKALAGAAAVVMAAGATEQVVVHHDPPPAAVRTAAPTAAARAGVAVVKPAAVSVTPAPQATTLAERRHRAAGVEAAERRAGASAGAKSRGRANAAERKASRHAASQRGAGSRSAASHRGGAGSSRGEGSRSGASQRGAGASRAATSRSGASPRGATASPRRSAQATASPRRTADAIASPRRTPPATSNRRSTKSAASRESAAERESAARESASSRGSAK